MFKRSGVPNLPSVTYCNIVICFWSDVLSPWRSVLCMLLLVCAGSTYIMENPLNSLVALHPRYVWFVEALQAHGIFDPQLVAHWNTVFACGRAQVVSSTTKIYNINFCSILEGILWPTKTYKIAFWMRKFGSMSFKRTWVWSCSKRICELDMGCLTPSEKNGSLQTTTRYVDKSGKRRFKGNALLKRSQWLVAKLIHILMFPNFAVFGPKF